MTTSSYLANRYEVLERIGQGGMGAVFRAQDRLQNQLVALKQVTVSQDKLTFASSGASLDFRLALAQEFHILAGLRHPHIIGVLDYGFDQDKQPFYTMDWLENARPLTAFAAGKSFEEKMRLLIETAHALAYLHRRGVLHRDLKPDNVLVVDNTAKVLDFGLAIATEALKNSDSDEIVGTLTYLAPELFMGEPYTVQSDLYALGVMAYELLAGAYPFTYRTSSDLLLKVMQVEPDFSGIHAPEAVIASVQRLMTKVPRARYESADELLRAWATWDKQTPDVAIRESYLQSARFIGREQEFTQLRILLQEVAKPAPILSEKPSKAWLIGGESGVGKSRLLDELRTQALVNGYTVVRVASVEGGGAFYQLWREVVRRLSVSLPTLDERTLAVLEEVVPHLGALHQRTLPTLTPLSADAQRERLHRALLQLFKEQAQPVLIILEDIHWEHESLEFLKYLLKYLDALPCMVLASYRDDERPDLPQDLSEMSVMRLQRFGEEDIALLLHYMLGIHSPSLTAFLARETEGNTFFLVEFVRALAEDAGNLHAIDTATLPQRIMTGGVASIIARRIARVPAAYQGLLKRCAVYGRQLDERVLAELLLREGNTANRGDSAPLLAFLNACAEASVLEVVDEVWQFSHDKLRHWVLDNLAPEVRIACHHDVAESIERAYGGEDASQFSSLAQHYLHSQNPTKAVIYTRHACRQLLTNAVYDEALALLTQVLALLETDAKTDSTEAAHLRFGMGEVLGRRGDFEGAHAHYAATLAIAEAQQDLELKQMALWGVGDSQYSLGQYDEAIDALMNALEIARARGDKHFLARIYKSLGNATARGGSTLKESTFYYHLCLEVAKSIEDKSLQADSLNNLGVNAYMGGDYPAAKGYYEQSLSLYEAIGHRWGVALSLNNIADLVEDDWQTARQYYERAIVIQRDINNQWGLGLALENLGKLWLTREETEQARACLEEARSIYEAIGDQSGCCYVYNALGDLYMASQPDQARDLYERSLALSEELNITSTRPESLGGLALLALEAGDAPRAYEHLRQALIYAWQTEENAQTTVMTVVRFAYYFAKQGQLDRAQELFGFVQTHPALPKDDMSLMTRVRGLLGEITTPPSTTTLEAICATLLA